MSQTSWEADKMLDVYIYDYMVKRNLQESAKAFHTEAKVSSDPVAIDAPGGFLFEWWSDFWDIFIARKNDKHSEVASSYLETQLIKAGEKQQMQPQQPQNQQEQQMQMQKLLLQKHAKQQQQQHHHHYLQQQQQQHQQQQQLQQQQREGVHLLNGATGPVGSDPFIRKNPGTANALATKMCEERLKLPPQRASLDDVSMKQRFGDYARQLLDSNHASILKSAITPGQASGQVLHGIAGGMSGPLQQVEDGNQQLSGAVPVNIDKHDFFFDL